MRVLSESTEWFFYFFVGIAVPAFAFFLSRAGDKRTILLPPTVAMASLPFFYYMGQRPSWVEWTVLSSVTLIHFLLNWYPARATKQHPLDHLYQFLILFGLWCLGTRLIWFIGFNDWLAQSPETIITFLLAFTVSYTVLHRKLTIEISRNVEMALIGLSAIVFLIMATRMDIAPEDNSFIVGPVSLLKQGGWLLWDVPSQYGFLNILTISWIPTQSPWIALYAVSSLLFFASSLLVFGFFYQHDRTFGGWFLATLVTSVSVFMFPGWLPKLSAVNNLPTVGGFRFIWSYLLLAIVTKATKADAKKWMNIGNAVWIISALWSYESLIFTSIIWFPAVVAICIENRMKIHIPIAKALGGLVCAIAVISLFYLIRLGHLPDFQAYNEYARQYRSGFGSMQMDLGGAMWILVLIFGLLAATLFTEGKDFKALRPIVLASGSLLWATSSYYVWRSHPSNLGALAPLFMTALSSVLFAPRSSSHYKITQTATFIFTTVLITATLGNSQHIEGYFRSLIEPRTTANFDQKFPKADILITQLLAQAQVGDHQPLVFYSTKLLVPSQHPAWLPFSPATSMSILPLDRQYIYMSRFFNRVRAGGWFLQSQRSAHSSNPVDEVTDGVLVNPKLIFKKLAETHDLKKTFENSEWRLDQFEVR